MAHQISWHFQHTSTNLDVISNIQAATTTAAAADQAADHCKAVPEPLGAGL